VEPAPSQPSQSQPSQSQPSQSQPSQSQPAAAKSNKVGPCGNCGEPFRAKSRTALCPTCKKDVHFRNDCWNTRREVCYKCANSGKSAS
jgi:membrane protease subunit (stomatin/prohibitin family)